MKEDTIELSYEQLLARVTHPKHRAFLENYPKFRITKTTAEAVGIGETTIYDWFLKCRPLREAFEALKKRIDAHRLQIYEAELDKRALEGTSKQSDILLMFALKAEAPDKYREKVNTIPFTGNIKVELSVPRPQLMTIENKQIGGGSNAIQGHVSEVPTPEGEEKG